MITVKPFNLAALKEGRIHMQNYSGEFKPCNLDAQVMPFKVGAVLIFAPFNFVVLFGSLNLQNEGHTNIESFTVLHWPHLA